MRFHEQTWRAISHLPFPSLQFLIILFIYNLLHQVLSSIISTKYHLSSQILKTYLMLTPVSSI
ncbi:hypothetical protein HMPREF3034_00934 [Prevotella sp. DNF00663]|nr:hypothetical protein HMPREF3034_00934 [Prevotella sp. DNF00663]